MNRADWAEIFWSRRPQAVRLPKEYRFDGTEVRIRRLGKVVIVEPIPTDWCWLDELVERGLDADVVEAAKEPPDEQERPDLEGLD